MPSATVDITALNHYFLSGATRPYAFRRAQLHKLRDAIIRYEAAIHTALQTDLAKSPEESYVTETGFVLAEITYTTARLARWMKPQRVRTNLLNFPSSGATIADPLGIVLIISPWNYPFQLLMAPLIGAIAAGNCAVLKPSEFAPATAAVMKQLIAETFSPEYIQYVEGDGAVVVPRLLREHRFDHIFYTGSTAVGREIYKMAAETLTPVTLELGGKSPCVVTASAALKVAARRIAMTKFSNAGQMCVAPDYVLVHASVKAALVAELKACITLFFGEHPEQSAYYGRIINDQQHARLSQYLKGSAVLHGGVSQPADRYLSPTLLDQPSAEEAVMQEEIFGPVLPIIGYEREEEALGIIRRHPGPLAFYVYSADRDEQQRWLAAVPSGGACINNCSWHLTNPALPFGGRGNSGMGSYHGRAGFETFSHRRAVMKTPTWFDPAIKYPPFAGKMKLFKWLIR